MVDIEESADGVEESLPIIGGDLVGRFGQEANIADEMRQAELDDQIGFAEVLAIGREIVAADDPLEVWAEDVEQDD